MAYFVKEKQFKGSISLTFEEGTYFDDMGDDFEKPLFIQLFGKELWDAFIAYPDDVSNDDLKRIAGELFKWFFYFYYVMYGESYSTTIGSMESESENATRNRQSRNYKAVKAYNRGVDEYPDTFKQLQDLGIYPELQSEPSTLEKQNVFGV